MKSLLPAVLLAIGSTALGYLAAGLLKGSAAEDAKDLFPSAQQSTGPQSDAEEPPAATPASPKRGAKGDYAESLRWLSIGVQEREISLPDMQGIARELLGAWAREDLDAALDYVFESYDNRGYPREAATVVFLKAIEIDAEGTWLRVVEHAEQNMYRELIGSYVEALAILNLREATAFVSKFPPGTMYERGRETLARVAFLHSTDAAKELLASFPAYTKVSLVRGIDSALMDILYGNPKYVASHRIPYERTAMEDIVHLLKIDQSKELHDRLKRFIGNQLAQESLPNAMQRLKEMDFEADPGFALAVFGSRTHVADKKEIFAFLESNSEYLRDPEFRQVAIIAYAKKDPLGFMGDFQRVYQQADSVYTTEDFRAGFKRFMDSNATDAANALVSIEDDALRQAGTLLIIEHLMRRREFRNAAEWARELKDEPLAQEHHNAALREEIVDLRRRQAFTEARETVAELMVGAEERERQAAEILSAEISYHTGHNNYQEARDAAALLEDPADRNRTIDGISSKEVYMEVNAGNFDKAMAATAHISDDEKRRRMESLVSRRQQEPAQAGQ